LCLFFKILNHRFLIKRFKNNLLDWFYYRFKPSELQQRHF